MQLGSFMKPDENEEEKIEWDEQLGAMGKGGGATCYTCGGIGHMSRDCASKGKGKSKGKSDGGKSSYGGFGKGESTYSSYGKGGFGKGGKGKGGKGKDGKGSGKGPQQGCWTCGGNHYQSNCPSGGKGGGLNHLDESGQDDWWQAESRPLCCLSTHIQKAFKEKEDWQEVGKRTKNDQMTKNHKAKKDNSFENINYWNELKSEEEDSIIDKELQTETFAEKQCCDNNVKGHFYRKQKEKEQEPKTKRTKCVTRTLCPLRTIMPEGLNPVSAKGEWELIEMAVDSGATETVVSDEMLTSVETKESWGSKKGVEYEVANGETIPNLGEKKFHGVTENGITRNLTAQVCEVNKALLSVKKIIAAGNRVTFDEAGSFIEDKMTGEKIWLKDEGGMFMLKMWVKNSFF